MANQNKIKDIWKRKDDYITSRIDLLSRKVDKSQNDLLSLMVADYMGDFKTDAAGNLLANVHNTRLALKIDKLMDALDDQTLRAVNTTFGKDMLRLTPISGRYYSAMGTPADIVKSIAEKTRFIEQSIGIEYTNVVGDNFLLTGKYEAKLIKGGYLDTLTKAPEVRQALKDYVTTSVVNKKGFQEYLKGMKEIVVGTKTRDGVLERYYKQFAYDTFNDTDAAINKHYADSLDLTWFVYQGSIIETSRAFCRKRAGKTFNTEETEKWKCDSTLIGKPKGKKCDDAYNPLIQRGKWRCRHTIRYITEDLACNNGRKEACLE